MGLGCLGGEWVPGVEVSKVGRVGARSLGRMNFSWGNRRSATPSESNSGLRKNNSPASEIEIFKHALMPRELCLTHIVHL